jgi:hypothetical protein
MGRSPQNQALALGPSGGTTTRFPPPERAGCGHPAFLAGRRRIRSGAGRQRFGNRVCYPGPGGGSAGGRLADRSALIRGGDGARPAAGFQSAFRTLGGRRSSSLLRRVPAREVTGGQSDFRWSDGALVVLLPRPNRPASVRDEVARLLEVRCEHTVQTASHTILLPIDARWTVFPSMAAPRLLIHKIDAFLEMKGNQAVSS